jgi:hypothetical protein
MWGSGLKPLLQGCVARGLRGFVGGQGLGGADVPVVVLGDEHRAAVHRRLVDVNRDRDGVGAGVADGVVLVRRDQAAGAAGAGLHAAGGAEAEALAVAFEQHRPEWSCTGVPWPGPQVIATTL